MELTLHQIDAFTQNVFSGNSAAVIILEHWLSDELMLSIAVENNLSETAFIVPLATDAHYAIRWFSPLTEIDFCGHATLASAFVLFEQNPITERLVFVAEAVGELTVKQRDNGQIVMSFPNLAPEPISDVPDDLRLGVSGNPVQFLRNGQAYFVVYENEQDVLNIDVDLSLLIRLAPYDVVVTAPSSNYDFLSRYFWPANGGDEDPVTGSIHAGLAPYWAEKLGKTELHALQASARRGELHCQVSDNRVVVSGYAVRYMQGQITVPVERKDSVI